MLPSGGCLAAAGCQQGDHQQQRGSDDAKLIVGFVAHGSRNEKPSLLLRGLFSRAMALFHFPNRFYFCLVIQLEPNSYLYHALMSRVASL